MMLRSWKKKLFLQPITVHPQSSSVIIFYRDPKPRHHAKNFNIMRLTDMLMLQTSVRSVSSLYEIMLEISCFFVEFTNI